MIQRCVAGCAATAVLSPAHFECRTPQRFTVAILLSLLSMPDLAADGIGPPDCQPGPRRGQPANTGHPGFLSACPVGVRLNKLVWLLIALFALWGSLGRAPACRQCGVGLPASPSSLVFHNPTFTTTSSPKSPRGVGVPASSSQSQPALKTPRLQPRS
jgi:hypothetical protein